MAIHALKWNMVEWAHDIGWRAVTLRKKNHLTTYAHVAGGLQLQLPPNVISSMSLIFKGWVSVNFLIYRTSSILCALVTVRLHILHSCLLHVLLPVIFFFFTWGTSVVTSAINFGSKQHRPQSQRSKYLHASLLLKHQGEEWIHKSLRNWNLSWIITQSVKLLAL